jgi:hypothetical protein
MVFIRFKKEDYKKGGLSKTPNLIKFEWESTKYKWMQFILINYDL